MKILNAQSKNFYSELDKIISKRNKIDKVTLKKVEKIVNDVRKNKDKALVRYERKFNNNSRIIPTKKEIDKAIKSLDPKVKKAIDQTYLRVKAWHKKQMPKDVVDFMNQERKGIKFGDMDFIHFIRAVQKDARE